jgi:hypothetical protein
MTTSRRDPYTGRVDHDGYNSVHPTAGDRMNRAFTFGSQRDPEAHAVEFSKTAGPLEEGGALPGPDPESRGLQVGLSSIARCSKTRKTSPQHRVGPAAEHSSRLPRPGSVNGGPAGPSSLLASTVPCDPGPETVAQCPPGVGAPLLRPVQPPTRPRADGRQTSGRGHRRRRSSGRRAQAREAPLARAQHTTVEVAGRHVGGRHHVVVQAHPALLDHPARLRARQPERLLQHGR